MPRRMMYTLISQKMAKLNHSVQGCAPTHRNPTPLAVDHHESAPRIAPTRVKIASPPIQVWIPNQPHATPARMSAGRFAPITPNEARANTGYGIPYFVPAWLISSIGTSTTTLPSMTVTTAWTQSIPSAMRPAASVQLGTLMAMPTQRAK